MSAAVLSKESGELAQHHSAFPVAGLTEKF